MMAGTSVLWPAASVLTPTACTSFSIAWRAHSSGVWNSGPMSTSKPRSANAVATTLAPRSWPSWPSLAIITRGRRPCSWAKAAISRLQLLPAFGRVVGSGIHAGHLLRVGAVAPEDLLQRIADFAHRGPQAHRLDAQRPAGCRRRFRPPPSARPAPPAPRRRRGGADAPAAGRSGRSRTRTLSIVAGCRSRPPGSRYLLTPTITSWPESMRACFSAAAASIFSLAQPRVDRLGHAAHAPRPLR